MKKMKIIYCWMVVDACGHAIVGTLAERRHLAVERFLEQLNTLKKNESKAWKKFYENGYRVVKAEAIQVSAMDERYLN